MQPRWLLLVVSLPGGSTSKARVATWRKLRRSGALALRDSVYLLPAMDEATEMANWLAGEISSVGGDMSIASVTQIKGQPDDELVRQFNKARDGDYTEIEVELTAAMKAAAKGGEATRRDLSATLRKATNRATELARIDFFGAEKGRLVRDLLDQARRLLETGTRTRLETDEPLERAAYRDRVWATRARPKIDRLASAWLIRHFIDPSARFHFIEEGGKAPSNALTFDTFGGDFTHEGEDCTFEVLVRRFGLAEPGLRTLAEIVHDMDLKDEKFDRPERSGLEHVVRGLVANVADDQALLAAAFPVFDALRTSLADGASALKPRRAARRRPPRRKKT